MKKNSLFIGLSGLLVALIIGCKKDTTKPQDNVQTEENELITTVKLQFSGKGQSGNDTTFTVLFDDPDGEGGNKPLAFNTIHLSKNNVYQVELSLLDKSKTPIDTISNEVLEKGTEHLFFYTPSDLNLASILITDKDTAGKNLGLKTTWTTKNAGTGKVKVILMHQPGVKDGVSSVGSTDVEVDFPMVIE
jgi:hypothetical protein